MELNVISSRLLLFKYLCDFTSQLGLTLHLTFVVDWVLHKDFSQYYYLFGLTSLGISLFPSSSFSVKNIVSKDFNSLFFLSYPFSPSLVLLPEFWLNVLQMLPWVTGVSRDSEEDGVVTTGGPTSIFLWEVIWLEYWNFFEVGTRVYIEIKRFNYKHTIWLRNRYNISYFIFKFYSF